MLLLLQVGADVAEVLLDVVGIGGGAGETGEGACCSLVASLLDEPARGFGEESHAASEDSSPDELDGNGDTVGGMGVPLGGGVVDDGGEEETNGDSPLVERDDGTANPFR